MRVMRLILQSLNRIMRKPRMPWLAHTVAAYLVLLCSTTTFAPGRVFSAAARAWSLGPSGDGRFSMAGETRRWKCKWVIGSIRKAPASNSHSL